MKISVQLYTLRSLMEKDFWGVLDRLSEAGFRNVELAGFYENSAEDVRLGLSQRGLRAHSMHVGIDQVVTDLDQTVSDAHTIGLEHVVVPWIDPKKYGGWHGVSKVLNEVGNRLAEHDLKFGYHNHDFEFQMEGEMSGFEILWNGASENLWAELDLFWVQKAGKDPVEWVNKLAHKYVQAHFKDMDKNGEFTEVGSGILDWDSIISSSKKAELQWAIIENDSPKINPLDAVVKSREFLLAKGLKD